MTTKIKMNSWKPSVELDGSGEWADNTFRFATKQEAWNWSMWSMSWAIAVTSTGEPVPAEDMPSSAFARGTVTRIDSYRST